MNLSQEIATGLRLVTAGAVIRASYVTKELADKLMSKAAISRGEDEGDELRYPADDGRSSIPFFELSQKGYIDLNREETKKHFSRLVNLVPDYLRERKIFPEKQVRTIESRIDDNLKKLIRDYKRVPKEDIIANAPEIAYKQQIASYFSKNELKMDGIGLLLSQDNLLETLYRTAKSHYNTFQIEQNGLKEIVEGFIQVQGTVKSNIDKCLDPFKRELEVAKVNKIASVELTVLTPSNGAKKMKMNIDDFYSHLDKDMLERFALHTMPDFPTRNYFGEKGQHIFDEIVKKRFCAELVKNFKDYSYERNNEYLMIIDDVNKKPVKGMSEIQELQNREIMREYVLSYKNPEPVLENIDKYFKAQEGIIQKASEILERSKSATPVDDVFVSQKEMTEYGYQDETMLAIRYEKAKEYLEKDMFSVYLLYTDGTEGQALSVADLEAHRENGGLFGIEKEEWDKSLAVEKTNNLDNKTLEDYGISVSITEGNEGKMYVFTGKDGKEAIFDERFTPEMRRNYNMPESIEGCLLAIGLSQPVIDAMSHSKVTADSLKEIIDSELEKIQRSETNLLERLGVSVQMDEFERGNVYTIVNNEGVKITYDERFDEQMCKDYNMPSSLFEAFELAGLDESESKECSELVLKQETVVVEEHISVDVTDTQVFVDKTVDVSENISVDKAGDKSTEITMTSFSKEERANLPFPEADAIVVNKPEEKIVSNIESQITEFTTMAKKVQR